MKITFDSENFLQSGTFRRVVCVILWVLAFGLVFHLGVMVGMHGGFHHHMRGGYTQGYGQQYTTDAGQGWGMQGGDQNVTYYTTGNGYDGNTVSGSAKMMYYRN